MAIELTEAESNMEIPGPGESTGKMVAEGFDASV